MSNMSSKLNGQSAAGFHNPPSALGSGQESRGYGPGGNQYAGSSTGNYMAVGGTQKGGAATGSALDNRTEGRGPNSSVLSTHSAAAKIRGNSYTPLPDRGVLREKSQN